MGRSLTRCGPGTRGLQRRQRSGAAAAGDVVGTRDPTENLAIHLVIAFLQQLVSVGDEDGLLETAYENLSPSDWGHAYWAVFRDFTDAEDPVSESLVPKAGRSLGMANYRAGEGRGVRSNGGRGQGARVGYSAHRTFQLRT